MRTTYKSALFFRSRIVFKVFIEYDVNNSYSDQIYSKERSVFLSVSIPNAILSGSSNELQNFTSVRMFTNEGNIWKCSNGQSMYNLVSLNVHTCSRNFFFFFFLEDEFQAEKLSLERVTTFHLTLQDA